MAGEPSIEFTGYAGEIKDFQDSSILNVSVHPGYTDKNTNQWVDKEPQFYGVRPLSNQAKDALNQVRQLKSQPNMSVKVLVNGSLSKRVSEKDGKRYENWDVAARTIAVLSAKPKAQQSGFQQSQQQYQQGFQQPQQGFQQPQQQYQQPTDPWSQPQDEYGNGQIYPVPTRQGFGGRTRPIPVRPLRQTIPLERFQPASSQTPVTQVAGTA